MARYVDVEGFSKLFDAEYKKTKALIEQGETHLDNLAEGFLEADRVIRNLPTLNVAIVKHGTWSKGKEMSEYAHCSACNRKMNSYCYGYAYCPLCGARMDGHQKKRTKNTRKRTITHQKKEVGRSEKQTCKIEGLPYWFIRERQYFMR